MFRFGWLSLIGELGSWIAVAWGLSCSKAHRNSTGGVRWPRRDAQCHPQCSDFCSVCNHANVHYIWNTFRITQESNKNMNHEQSHLISAPLWTCNSVQTIIQDWNKTPLLVCQSRLFNKYLYNLAWFVLVDGVLSSSHSASQGVPQRSVIDWLLFIIYVNNLS